MRYYYVLPLLLCLFFCQRNQVENLPSIIPLPQQMKALKGEFVIDTATVLQMKYDDLFAKEALRFTQYLLEHYGIRTSTNTQTHCITFRHNRQFTQEAYQLQITPQGIIIESATSQGAFYALQTLYQVLPLPNELQNRAPIVLKGVKIVDEPRFSYRGGHLDVGRHFFTVDSIKRYIDILAMHKLNTFHWHLTEDQGWRIEIKKYPKLTSIGGFRKGTIDERSGKVSHIQHGGFYTQDEVREIVNYAADKYISVIPEIDMPGHIQSLLAAYPHLGCVAKQYEVRCEWGVSNEVLCLGNPNTMSVVYDIIDEVLDLFPAPYFHIGGDECPKDSWEKCPKCQSLIQNLNLIGDESASAEQKLQSYFTKKIEQYVNAKGRTLIGWEEIMEGGLSATAVVMAWKSANYAYQAAAMGNKAILTPAQICYLNYYQNKNIDNEPMALNGVVTLEDCYNFEPLPDTLSVQQRKNILGIQANLWGEYIVNFRTAEYMLLPRISAIAEVGWSSAKKNYTAFLQRSSIMLQRYKNLDYAYSKAMYDIEAQLSRSDNNTQYLKLSAFPNAKIHYTTDGSTPTNQSPIFKDSIAINASTTIRAIAYLHGISSNPFILPFHFNKATLANITPNSSPYPFYTFSGVTMLNDGVQGNNNYRSGYWLGYNDSDLSITLAYDSAQTICSAHIRCMVATSDWIFRPTKFCVYGSNDNINFSQIASKEIAQPTNNVFQIENYELSFSPVSYKYFKVELYSLRTIPDFHPAKGKPAFLFVDEIFMD